MTLSMDIESDNTINHRLNLNDNCNSNNLSSNNKLSEKIATPEMETKSAHIIEEGTQKQNGNDSVVTKVLKEECSNSNADSTEKINEVMKSKKSSNFLVKFFENQTKGLTTRQKKIIVVFAFVELFAATVISIQAPFYPKEAESKGATSSQHGWVFGIFELIVFIMSPVFGEMMNRWNPKKVFNYGIFTTGASCIVFGFLNHIDDSYYFIVTSLIVRSIEAVGDAAFVTASFTIIALEFPESVATTFATMETFYGLGMILGPVLGGFLYDLGGYTFPFVLMGGCLFICAVATHFVLPSINVNSTESTEDGIVVPPTSSGFGIFKMIMIPAVAIIAYSIVSTAAGVGFLADTLQHHLKQFGIESSTVIGCIFILNGGVYALTAPIWGRICDNITQQKYITLVGAFFTIVGFLVIGPAPFIPLESNLWATCIGLVLFGLGLGATLVSAFMQMMKDTIDKGHPDDVSTYGKVSGLWTSMTALGFFIGPVAGGTLLQHVGFRNASLCILGGQIVLVILVLMFLIQSKRKSRSFGLEDGMPKENQQFPRHEMTEKVPVYALNASYIMD